MKSQSASGKPFFCYLATAAPHAPLWVAQKYRDLYPGQARGVATFFGMISNFDENLGKLDAFLRDAGLRENTLLVYLTDNGATNGFSVHNAGMRGKKIDLWEGGHRVPCFVRWPAGGLRAPGDVAELTQVQDLLPTLADLCGLKKPENLDGVSLAGLLRGKEERLADRTLVVQFSRMNAPVPKKGDACVLWKRWRLVADRELYDLSTDPGQKENVLEKHPEIVAKLRASYDAWWSRVEPRMNEFSRIVIGADAENPSLLSPADWQDSFLDQSRQVRMGEPKNGVWGLTVDRDGEYEFALRRWPEESDLPIRAGVPATKVTDGELVAGKALPVAKARLKIGGFDEGRPVGEADKAAVFSVRLKAGPAELQTWFLDAADQPLCGAYAVTVLRK
jgi:arylsulfatase